jgi:hypothetical protein
MMDVVLNYPDSGRVVGEIRAALGENNLVSSGGQRVRGYEGN